MGPIETLVARSMRSPSPDNAGILPAVRFLHVLQQLRRYPGLGYTTACVAITVATVIQWLARDQFAGAPFLLIYPAIILTTLVGGLGPGFLGAILSGISQWGLFIAVWHPMAVVSYSVDATICVLLIVLINQTLDLLLTNIEREKRAKHQQYLLAGELHHRIQNLFTVIQAVIRFSLPGDEMVRESAIKKRLIDRLQSMSATNRAITDSMGDGVRLLDLVNSEIRGFESQFDIGGATGLLLGSQATQNLALILHELVTNSLKYGALSVRQGRINIGFGWSGSVLTFVWREHGGPPVKPPTRASFGSLILGTFANGFCKKVDARYAATGFQYALQIGHEQLVDAELVPAADVASFPIAPAALSEAMRVHVTHEPIADGREPRPETAAIAN